MKGQICDILTRLTSQGKTFSAHDVTKQVRAVVGVQSLVGHDEVRPTVHEWMTIFISAGGKYKKVDTGTYISYEPIPKISTFTFGGA